MRVYFNGLKCIRFVAASMVIIHHIEQYKCIFHLENAWENGVIRNLGDRGVSLFFVLSGFLITFLLLKEKEFTNTIQIRFFYIRRILRIWPLYFLIVLSSIFFFPQMSFFQTNETFLIRDHFTSILLLSIAILPNITMFLFGAVPFSSQAWSIGVEEQFYILWPLIIKYVKNTGYLLFAIIGILFLLQNGSILIPKLFGKNTFEPEFLFKLSLFFKFFRIDCMAFGSLGALLAFRNSTLLRYLYSPIVSFLLFTFVIGLFLMPIKFMLFDNLIQSLLYTLLIVNIACNPNCFYSIENSFVNRLGDISYGMYMYHPVICFTIIKFFGRNLNNIGLYGLIFIFTILIAYASYFLYEKKFVDLKVKKFAIIKST